MKKSSYIDLLVQLALWSNSKFGKLIDSQAIKFEYWKGTHVGSCGKFARKSLCHPCAPSSGNHLTLPSIRKLLRGPRLMGDVDTRPRARQLADLHGTPPFFWGSFATNAAESKLSFSASESTKGKEHSYESNGESFAVFTAWSLERLLKKNRWVRWHMISSILNNI